MPLTLTMTASRSGRPLGTVTWVQAEDDPLRGNVSNDLQGELGDRWEALQSSAKAGQIWTPWGMFHAPLDLSYWPAVLAATLEMRRGDRMLVLSWDGDPGRHLYEGDPPPPGSVQ